MRPRFHRGLPSVRRRVAVCLAAAGMLVWSGSCPAAERLARLVGVDEGLPVAPVFGIAQDRDGFLWLGTHGGLVRYDGQQVRLWTHKPLTRVYSHLVSREGTVYAFDESGRLFTVVDHGVQAVIGPRGAPLQGVDSAVIARDGALWVAQRGKLLRRAAQAGWEAVPLPDGMESPQRLRRAEGEAIWVATERRLWRISPDGGGATVASVERFRDVISGPQGRILVLDWPDRGRVRAIDGATSRSEVLFLWPARPIDMLVRGETVWVAFDHYLAKLDGTDGAVVLGEDDGVRSAGNMLVDEEGSLWFASYRGAVQFPEPETALWSASHGMPRTLLRWVTLAKRELWVTAWRASARLSLRGSEPPAELWDRLFVGPHCTDAEGRVWLARPAWTDDGGRLLSRLSGRVRVHRFRALSHSCASSNTESGLFVAHMDGLLWIPQGSDRPIAVAPPPAPPKPAAALLEDHTGRLWIETDRGLCRAPVHAILANDGTDWSCLGGPPGAVDITDLIETERGRILASTRRRGIWHLADLGWSTLPIRPELPAKRVTGLEASPSGGLWVFGAGFLWRIEEGTGARDSYDVVERITAWHGLPGGGAADVAEREDGTLWVAGSSLARIPASTRRSLPDPPQVRLTSISVAGQPARVASKLEVAYADNRIGLRFVAPSFRDPGRLVYRVRSRADQPWTETTEQPAFRLADLAPGRYRIEVAASLDGERWSPEPARLTVMVHPPWYLRGWFLVPAAVALAVILYSAHRLRIALLLRLERQRLRIAMDLHDEVGSGLGSLGIMGDLVGSDELEPGERARLGRRIATSAHDLGNALSEIVWALRTRSGDLAGVARHVVERAQTLLPNGELRQQMPEAARLAQVRLSLPVRRNVTLIAQEALHNAAKHAETPRVEIGLVPRSRRWCLWIRDHGIGFDPEKNPYEGVGLASMRLRAEQIGALLEVRSAQTSGTIVSLTFSPRAKDRRLKHEHRRGAKL